MFNLFITPAIIPSCLSGATAINKSVISSARRKSPYKFAADVYESLTGEKPSEALAALDELSAKTNTEIPYPLRGIADRKVNFTKVVKATDMPDAVLEYISK